MWEEARHRIIDHPKSSILGVLSFLSGMGVIAIQFGYDLGHTPNGKSGATLIVSVTALLTGLLWKTSDKAPVDPIPKV